MHSGVPFDAAYLETAHVRRNRAPERKCTRAARRALHGAARDGSVSAIRLCGDAADHRRYVDGIDFSRDAVFAVRPAATSNECRGALAGVAHAALPDDVAELGISVLPRYRGRGLGSTLAQRAIAYARSRGMRALAMQVLRQNTSMLRIARKLGMTIVDRGVELFARLELLGGNRRREPIASSVLRSPLCAAL